MTQDTTGNSINVFDSVPFVAQLPCAAHTNELIVFHGVDDNPILLDATNSIKKLMVRAKGNCSSKRRNLLVKKCEEASVKFRNIYLPGPTRWGGHVDMSFCFEALLPAFRLISDDDIPTSREDQTLFSSLLEDSLENHELVQACLPFLTLVLEWTQVATAANTPTSGLVLLMINRIYAALEHLMSLSTMEGVERPLRNQIRDAYNTFKYNVDKYYNTDFCDFWIYKVCISILYIIYSSYIYILYIILRIYYFN